MTFLKFFFRNSIFTIPLVVILALAILGGGLEVLLQMIFAAGLILAIPLVLIFLLLLYVGYKKLYPEHIEEEAAQTVDASEDIDDAWAELSDALTKRLGFFDFNEANVTKHFIEFQDANGALIRVTKGLAEGAELEQVKIEITSYKIEASAGEHYGKAYESDEEAIAFYSEALLEVIDDNKFPRGQVQCKVDDEEIHI